MAQPPSVATDGVEHVQAVQRQHAGHPAEQARPVGGDDGEACRPRRRWPARPPRSSARCSAVGNSSATSCASPPPSTWSTRATSARTRPAFQSLQAAGPVASESASVRAASSSSTSRLPSAAATPSMVAGSSMSRRVATSGQQQVVAAQGGQHRRCRGRRGPCGAPIVGQQAHAVVGVVAAARPCRCRGSRPASTSRSGRATRPASAPAPHRGLPQVPVDGEAVVGVALRLAAHAAATRASSAPRRPAGRAPRAARGPAGRPASRSTSAAPGRVRPRRGRHRRLGGQAGQRRAGRAGCRAAAATAAARSGSAGSAATSTSSAMCDLAVAQAQAAAQRRARAGPGPAGRPASSRCGPRRRRWSRRWCGRPGPPPA